jgi:hypothetical protein
MSDSFGRGRTLVFNGIDATTGGYSLSGLDPGQVLEVVSRRPSTGRPRGPIPGVDVKNLAASGWGVVFPRNVEAAVREALGPLLALRRRQVGNDRLFRVLEYDQERNDPPRAEQGESLEEFFLRHGVSFAQANPVELPYYLLLVGGPEAIPFSFQFQLDVQYAVGRLAFDTPEEYARYTDTVVAAEERRLTLPRRVALFGVLNEDDLATDLSTEQLVAPLADALAKAQEARRNGKGPGGGAGSPEAAGGTGGPPWEIASVVGRGATKARLQALLGGDETPALAFTASHGLCFRPGHQCQLDRQGSLLCSDWPGPKKSPRPIPEESYLSAADVADGARPAGLVAFHFACYSAGTPLVDDFAVATGDRPEAIAARPFVARLAQRLLGHPRGGALAVIGHVERAWGYSFFWQHLKAQVQPFAVAFEAMLDGCPVGGAMESFGQRYATLATQLVDALERREAGEAAVAARLKDLWTAHNDAKSYALLGDPAVRMVGAGCGSP